MPADWRGEEPPLPLGLCSGKETGKQRGMVQARVGHDPESPCQAPLSLFLPLILQDRFVYNGTLKDSHGYQNARFGSSIASVRDLNQDSYNDGVVGAPLEDNHGGVIYVYHGFQGSILKTPKQVPPPTRTPRMNGARTWSPSISFPVLTQERIALCPSSTCLKLKLVSRPSCHPCGYPLPA